MKNSRVRLDLLLVEKGAAGSRSQAQALIMAHQVKVDGKLETKAGTLFPPDAHIDVLQPPKYVGRGGSKLEKALEVFGVDPRGRICMDIGSSTGGFTDCLLQRGASLVYAVDVGRGQLDWKLRQDPRVVSLEKTNARYISRKEIPEEIDLCTMDVSFISVKKILPAAKSVVSPGGEFLVLVKPQFEAGPRKVRKGIVREKAVHEEVLSDMTAWVRENGFFVRGLTHSPIKGGDGNIEFFLHLNYLPPGRPVNITSAVGEAHVDLEKT